MRNQPLKLLLSNGLTALCNHIKSIKATSELAGSAVAALAESTAGSLEEIDTALDEKQGKGNAVTVSIPTSSGWNSSTVGPYRYYYDISVTGVAAKDRADIIIAPASVATATACGLCPTTETLAGKIRIRSVSKPSATITAQYWLTIGKE